MLFEGVITVWRISILPVRMDGITIRMGLISGKSCLHLFLLSTHNVIHSAYAAYISGILINVVGFAGASTYSSSMLACVTTDSPHLALHLSSSILPLNLPFPSPHVSPILSLRDSEFDDSRPRRPTRCDPDLPNVLLHRIRSLLAHLLRPQQDLPCPWRPHVL